jgi:hypothetical protein
MEAALESLHEIEDLIKGFPANGKIPSIEIDLTLQKIRNMYELMLMMKDRDVSVAPEVIHSTVKEPEVASRNKTFAEPVQEKKTISEEIVFEETKIEEKQIPVEEIKSKESVKEEVVIVKTSTIKKNQEKEVQTLSDQFKGKTTLHESLHQSFSNERQILSSTKPVADLLSAIGINDRFTFIRELFDNNSAAFEKAITVLNNAANFNDAYNFISQQFDWDMNSQPVQMLLDIIRRKFITGRNE